MRGLNLIIPIITFLGFIMLNGCCSCTEIACHSENNPSITVSLNLQDDKYDITDFEDVLLILTDQNLISLDSTNVSFIPVTFESRQLKLILDKHLFNQVESLSDFGLLLCNTNIDQIDTLSEINYMVSTMQEVCNECQGGISCSDEYFTKYAFENKSIEFNGHTLSSFDLEYRIK